MSKMESGSNLSPKMREWLGHIRACEQSGQSVKSYAADHDLSLHGLYQAATDLRKLGVLPPVKRSKPKKRKEKRVESNRFIPVTVSHEVESDATWCIRFPSGVVLESARPLSAPDALLLIESLARQR